MINCIARVLGLFVDYFDLNKIGVDAAGNEEEET